MSTNVEKLKKLGRLGAVRQRLGAKDQNDTKLDERINHMSPTGLCAAVSGWLLGDEDWARLFIELYKSLSK